MKHFLGLATASLLTQVVFGDVQNPPTAWPSPTAIPTPPAFTKPPKAPNVPNPAPAGFPDFPSHPGGFPTGRPSPPKGPGAPPGAPPAPPAPPAGPPDAPPSAPTSEAPAPGPPAPVSPQGPKAPSESDHIPAAQCGPGPKSARGDWSPLVVAHIGSSPNQQCPTNTDADIHWFLDADQIGCCTQNAYLSTASPGQFACCQCGTNCAGLPPPMLQDWTLTGELFRAEALKGWFAKLRLSRFNSRHWRSSSNHITASSKGYRLP